jgi:hypothetical protein
VTNPPNQHAAARQARVLLAKRLPGSRRGTVAARLVRAERIADTIWRRWQVGPYQWQVKHLRWYLTAATGQYTAGTRYRHWLTVRALAFALDKGNHWLAHLKGPWLRPRGQAGVLQSGRPPKLPR